MALKFFRQNELEQTINYLQENWTDKELRILALKLEDTLILLSQNPKLFQVIEVTNKIRRVVILSHNTLYYKIKKIKSKSFHFSPIVKTQTKDH